MTRTTVNTAGRTLLTRAFGEVSSVSEGDAVSLQPSDGGDVPSSYQVWSPSGGFVVVRDGVVAGWSEWPLEDLPVRDDKGNDPYIPVD